MESQARPKHKFVFISHCYETNSEYSIVIHISTKDSDFM
jgi:hypothetical protein